MCRARGSSILDHRARAILYQAMETAKNDLTRVLQDLALN